MHRPRVLLDVDGVLADFLTPALDVIERLTGIRYDPAQITTWDIFDTVGKEWEQPFFEACNTRGFAASLSVYPGAQEGVTALREVAEVYIVTSPLNHNPTWTYERELWLKEHFGIPANRIVHTSAKFLCRGDALVDDRPHNIQRWNEEHPEKQGLLWDASWNRTETGLIRVLGWADLLTRVTPR